MSNATELAAMERLAMMCEDDQSTWDLSPKDVAAIRAVREHVYWLRAQRDDLRARLAALEATPAQGREATTNPGEIGSKLVGGGEGADVRRAALEDAAKLATHVYGEAVAVDGLERPSVVGAKIARAIRGLAGREGERR